MSPGCPWVPLSALECLWVSLSAHPNPGRILELPSARSGISSQGTLRCRSVPFVLPPRAACPHGCPPAASSPPRCLPAVPDGSAQDSPASGTDAEQQPHRDGAAARGQGVHPLLLPGGAAGQRELRQRHLGPTPGPIPGPIPTPSPILVPSQSPSPSLASSWSPSSLLTPPRAHPSPCPHLHPGFPFWIPSHPCP